VPGHAGHPQVRQPRRTINLPVVDERGRVLV